MIQKERHIPHCPVLNTERRRMTMSLNAQSSIVACALLLGTATSNVCHPCACSENRMDCSNRGLSTVPNFFPNFTMWLDLSQNDIKSIGPQAFFGAPNLIYLNISGNGITSLNGSAFIGLSELLYLDLNGNPMPYASGFANDVFLPLVKLKELYLLTDDCPQQPPDKLLHRLSTLETVAIVLSNGGRIGDRLGSLRHLHTLMLTSVRCPVQRLNSSDIQTVADLPIRRLSLRNTGLTEIDPAVLTLFSRTLAKLDLSCNSLLNLPSIIDALRGSRLETLLLDDAVYDFTVLKLNEAFFDALGSTPLKVLTMARNSILEIDLGKAPSFIRMPNLRYLRAGYNELLIHPTSSKVTALQTFLSILFHLTVLDVQNLINVIGNPDSQDNNTYCRGLDPLFSDDRQPWEDDTLHYPAPKEFWAWLLAATYRFDVEDLVTLPPKMTRLYASNLGFTLGKFSCIFEKIYFKNNLQILDFSGTSITDIDCGDSGLSTATDIELRHTGLKRFNPGYFSKSSMPQLSLLDLSGNSLGSFIESSQPIKGVFDGMNGIRSLDLSANDIAKVPKDVFAGLRNVTHINVSRNSISSWDANIFSLSMLICLDISSNHLSTLTKKAMQEFDAHNAKVGNFVVNMSSNPIPCSCENADFLQWLTDTKVSHGVVNCLDGSTSKPLDAQLLRNLEWRCEIVPVLIVVLSVAAVLLIATILLYFCRWRLRYLFYNFKRLSQRKTSAWLADKIGVYVSYHDSEAGMGKRFCDYLESQVKIGRVVTRHSIAPGHYELEQIAVSIDECHVSVILTSPESLRGSKAEIELYMSLEKGMHYVLPIIITESLNLAQLPRMLRKLLTSNYYLRLPPTLSTGNNSDYNESCSSMWQRFFLVFESWLLNMIEKQTSRVTHNIPNGDTQRADAHGDGDGDEPLLIA